jgi:hypothetical protein
VNEGRIDADVVLPPRPGATVRLRLRLPGAYVAERVEVIDRDDVKLSLEGDLVRFPRATLGKVALRVWCARTGDD